MKRRCLMGFTQCSVHHGAVRSSEMLESYHNTTRHHNPEDLYLNFHRRENFKSRMKRGIIFSSCEVRLTNSDYCCHVVTLSLTTVWWEAQNWNWKTLSIWSCRTQNSPFFPEKNFGFYFAMC